MLERRVVLSRTALGRAGAVGVVLLALVPQAGCGREFFREWANQDVSEAVFEKSRDPRWRIELFTIEPPAMSRFANPGDPDTPPAPPDDFAAQSLSPVPQWPDQRLLVPTEGTGYLDMMEGWSRDRRATVEPPPNVPGEEPEDNPANPLPGAPPADTGAPAMPPPAGTRPPFQPGMNSGPGGAALTPIPVPGTRVASSPGRQAGSGGKKTQARAPLKDIGVRLAAHQATGIPMPVPPTSPDTQPAGPARPYDPFGAGPPGSRVTPEPTQPMNVRPDQTPEEYRAAQAATAEMAGILVAGAVNLDETEAAGLPPGTKPYVINPAQSLKLALINNRAYQFQLENLYIQSLAVTLQRFQFEPQFFAGMGPTTSTSAGIISSVTPNFLYRTKETGSQVSALNLGTVAGVGKVFISGGRLLAGFANQMVWNFTGKSAKQPAVQSALPLSFVQPFLRGGGRAITLEPLTLAERNLLYQVRLFARFRQEFMVAMLGSGNTGSALSGAGTNDPIIGYIFTAQQLLEAYNDQMNVAAFEQLYKVFTELVKGEPSGLTQLQVDQMDLQLQNAKATYLNDIIQYRNALDQFKWQLGLPPDLPLVLDMGVLNGFRDVFNRLNRWAANPRRELSDLDKIVDQLPGLDDVIIDGRSVLELGGVETPASKARGDTKLENHPEKLEELLLAAERVTLENRVDLMNARAQLYDAWRQIKFTANALQGVLNVSVTNQILTPPTTTNPFAFVDQAKNFSLVLNTELPLIRLTDRNNFRQSLINYERQRRSLMANEDSLKFQIRSEVRNLQLQAQTYVIRKRAFVLSIRQKDQAQEQLIAPPAAGAANQASQAAVQTQNVIQAQSSVINSQNQLLLIWVNYVTQRMVIYRDLGIIPFDEWEAYYELFPYATRSPSADSDAGATTGMGPPPAPTANAPAGVRS